MAAGAVLTSAALVAMAYAPTVWSATLALWLLTFSINIVMEPFRALMGDIATPEERDQGFSMQVLFIGAGAVFASVLPWMFVNWGGVAANDLPGRIPASVRDSFAVGALGLLLTVMWTVTTTQEKPLAPVQRSSRENVPEADRFRRSQTMKRGGAWVAIAIAIVVANVTWTQRREAYLLAAVLGVFGALHWFAARSRIGGRNPLAGIASEVIGMPAAMRRLAVVQFFTWFGLFALWVYAVPAVAQRYYGNPAAGSLAYEDAANWVGMLFAVYNGVAALAALLLPRFVTSFGRRRSHALCLGIGALGLISFVTAPTAIWLWLSVLAIGCGWAAILAIPYAIVAEVVPAERMGVYMGIHNVFLVLPQLAAAALLGPVVRTILHGNISGAIVIAGGAMLVGAVFTLTIPTID
jgi:maltose/moltooligosaccharide transporter